MLDVGSSCVWWYAGGTIRVCMTLRASSTANFHKLPCIYHVENLCRLCCLFSKLSRSMLFVPFVSRCVLFVPFVSRSVPFVPLVPSKPRGDQRLLVCCGDVGLLGLLFFATCLDICCFFIHLPVVFVLYFVIITFARLGTRRQSLVTFASLVGATCEQTQFVLTFIHLLGHQARHKENATVTMRRQWLGAKLKEKTNSSVRSQGGGVMDEHIQLIFKIVLGKNWAAGRGQCVAKRQQQTQKQ